MKTNCPYCSKEIDIELTDIDITDGNYLNEHECPECGKNFTFTTDIIISVDTYQADCLNDGKHNYQLINTCPREASKMRCTMCGDERELTEEERKFYNIGTMEDYFKSLNK